MKNWQKLVITFFVAAIALLAQFVFGNPLMARVVITIAGSILALSMFVGMIKTLRSGNYGVDLLAITAIIATLLVGECWAALIIIVMLVGGESLEDYAAGVAHRELTNLLQKSPSIAHVKAEDGKIVDSELDAVKVGTTLLIKPLEVVPIDGVLSSEHATLDEASLTGETKPYELSKGDVVMSGSINTDSTIEIQTTEEAANSQLQKIVTLVKEAESQPAHFVRLADRYAIPFTIAAYVIAGVAFAITKEPVRIAQVLVVASPCPLILAAPIAFVSGMSRSSKNGVLIKNGTIIEKLATAKSIFFDKTGTITSGKLAVSGVIPESGISKSELESLVYSIENSSNHILAKSFVAYAEENGIQPLPTSNLTEVPGMGISAEIDGKHIKIGRASFAGAPDDAVTTAFYVSSDERFIGQITFSDQLRANAKSVMTELKKLKLKDITMLTGDNEVTANAIAEEVGITDVHASLLPEQKLDLVKSAVDKPSIMVGDGVNDAPALALSDVGIAMGLGESTVASETADMILLKNDLESIPTAIRISRDTMTIAKQAVLIGIFICVVLMLIAATGLIPATIGALFQEVVDTVSIFYALRALRGINRKS
ncbi:MAG: cadmium-translocating P-type ATPase [Streptococcaceae bacterium]|jgi:heavy metal translocating P-type ATPase|nr:cadmium-translocating P-type ATPase [Streptococcaceae bacterium]